VSELKMAYRLVHKTIGELHVFTSPDVPGLYVANPDETVAHGQVAEAVAAIERISERARERMQVQQRYA
jgi:hypothetical protein